MSETKNNINTMESVVKKLPKAKISSFFINDRKKLRVAGFALIPFLIFLIYFFWFHKSNPQVLAQEHFNKNFNNIASTNEDQNQFIDAYNDQNYSEAILYAENFIAKNYENKEALLVLGLSHVALNEFDIALQYFSKLTNVQITENNYGLFLQAITLMIRNKEGDVDEANFFLNQVVNENAPGTQFAKRWLKKF